MAIIAMTREMGSGGQDVARRLSELLGLSLILHEVVEDDVARHAEVRPRAIRHAQEGGASLRERWQIGPRRLAGYVTEEILELAARGNVVLRGWGACAILRDVPRVARIRICASLESRMRAVIGRPGIPDRQAATAEIARNDEAHRRVLARAYGVDREDPLLYHMVLNTDRLSTDACVGAIRSLVEQAEFQETEETRTRLKDKVIEAQLRAKLAEHFVVGMGVSGLKVQVEQGTVRLAGRAIHSALAEDVAAVAGQWAGVRAVENRIEVVRGPRIM